MLSFNNDSLFVCIYKVLIAWLVPLPLIPLFIKEGLLSLRAYPLLISVTSLCRSCIFTLTLQPLVGNLAHP